MFAACEVYISLKEQVHGRHAAGLSTLLPLHSRQPPSFSKSPFFLAHVNDIQYFDSLCIFILCLHEKFTYRRKHFLKVQDLSGVQSSELQPTDHSFLLYFHSELYLIFFIYVNFIFVLSLSQRTSMD